jgi:hypothetical protein
MTQPKGESNMWIAKGLLLGTGFFVVGTLAFLVHVFGISTQKATGLTAVTGVTINNPMFWVALLACLMLGCALAGSLPVKFH